MLRAGLLLGLVLVAPGASGGFGGQKGVPLARFVQVSVLGGESGGALQVEVVDGGRVVAVPLHLGSGTGADEAAAWIAARLEAGGVRVHGPAAGGRSLFVEDAEKVSAFADGGFRVSVAAVDGGIAALRVVPLDTDAVDTSLALSMSTVSAHDGSRDRQVVEVPLTRAGGSPGAAARLHEATSKLGWVCERPGGSGWRPVRDNGGRDVVGLAVTSTQSGWQLVLELEAP